MKKGLFLMLFLFAGLVALAQIPNNLTSADKVYGLSKFWQEVNYNFVYINRVNRAKWDSTYRQLITTVQQTKNDYEYYRELQKFCALLKDGHTNIFLPPAIDTLLMRTVFGPYRLFMWNIDEKAIIACVNLSKKDEIPVGSEIIEVNGLSTKEYINKQIAPYISSSTDYILEDASIYLLLQGFKGDTYRLKIKKPNDEIFSLNVTHARSSETEVYPPAFNKEWKLFDFKWYDHQIAYLALNSFEDPKIDTLFINVLPELYKAKGLIIDLRNNGGGSTDIGTNILKYLTRDSLLYGPKQASRLHIPAYKAWGQYVKATDTINNAENKKKYLSFHDIYFYNFDYAPDTMRIKAGRIVVPTVILTSNNTGSAAEDFLIYADNQKHMIKMGEKTYGSTGQPLSFDLPGGGSARVCTKKDTYPDGREFVGFGIKPDIEVKQTLNDFIQNKDRGLDRAIEYLNGKMK